VDDKLMLGIQHPQPLGESTQKMKPSSRSRTCRSTSLLNKTCLSVLVALALGTHANAQQPAQTVRYEVQAGDLTQVINQISRSSGVQIVYDIELLRGKQAAAVAGDMTLAQALDRALAGTGLQWEQVSPTTVSVTRKARRARSKNAEQTSPGTTESEASTQREARELERTVVVGSRLGSSPVESAMPIKVITREDIDRSGASSIAQMLTYLPEVPINNGEDIQIMGQTSTPSGGNNNSSTVQMRGMPRGTTLVLINGRRAGDSAAFSNNGFFDLSTIPLALVDRIEVLPAGASAVYGGDALAGVINIVLRKDASGTELRVRQTSADGYDSSQASILWARSGSRGGLTIAGSWNKGSGLWNDERALTADMDFRRYGGMDMRTALGNPANFYSLEGCPPSEFACVVPLEQRGNLPGMDSPVASVPEGSNGVGLTPSDLVAAQSKVNMRRHLRSPETRYGLNIDGRWEVLPHLELFTELTYTHAEVPAFQVPLSSIYSGQGGKRGVLAADNPLNPFGVEVGFDFFSKETGLYQSFSNEHARGLLGIRGNLARFEWEVTGWQVRDKSGAGGVSDALDLARIYEALADPASGFNPLVADGSAPAPHELLESFYSLDKVGDMRSRTSGINAFARGTLLRLPAGSMTALLGMESQTYTIDFETNNPGTLIPSVHGSSTNRAAFAELRAPILSAREGQVMERLAMTGAVRRETSDRFQSAALTSTIGIEFRPWESLLLRSTYSTGFRPIVTHNALQNPYESWQNLLDPQLNERYLIRTITTGGAPADLAPETSRTMTVGLVYRPAADWSMSLTHWNIRLDDEMRQLGAYSILENESLYPHRVIRNAATGQVEVIDGRSVNISLKETAGADVMIESTWSTPIGEFLPSVAATYIYQFDQQLTDTSPVVSSLSKYNSAGWAPRWKIIPRLGWEYRDQARAMLVGRYVSAYDDTIPFMTGPRAGTYQQLGDFWMFDLNLDVSLGRVFRSSSMLSGVNLNVGATNLFNRLPDFCNACGFSGYDASQYDIMGRTVYAELRMNF
jgi:iron complex outermembrane receptor protein